MNSCGQLSASPWTSHATATGDERSNQPQEERRFGPEREPRSHGRARRVTAGRALGAGTGIGNGRGWCRDPRLRGFRGAVRPDAETRGHGNQPDCQDAHSDHEVEPTSHGVRLVVSRAAVGAPSALLCSQSSPLLASSPWIQPVSTRPAWMLPDRSDRLIGPSGPSWPGRGRQPALAPRHHGRVSTRGRWPRTEIHRATATRSPGGLWA